MIKSKFITSVASIVLILIFCTCGSTTPDEKVLERVKQSFLEMRFYAPYLDQIKGMDDKQLFENSCKHNRVNCTKILELLKSKDKKFYERLMSSR